MSDTRLANRILPDAEKTRRFVFVLLENFTMLSFASAVECLRIANRMAGRTLYTWSLVGEGGGTVAASAGVVFNLDGDLPELTRDDTVIVCGGLRVRDASGRPQAIPMKDRDIFDFLGFD